MFSFRACQAIVLGALLIATPSFATRTHRSATSGHIRHHHLRHHVHEVRGQRQIDPDRAKEIQDALIREHYLPSPASGQWDASTEAAMEKYQADHGWQTKLVPDSRALIKLGLGPKDDAVPASTASVTPMAASNAGAPAPVPGTLADAHSIPN
jgi:Putative peptidoglycan binding domain